LFNAGTNYMTAVPVIPLTAVQAVDLTDAGDTALHYHAADRDLANAIGILPIANGGATGVNTGDNATNSQYSGLAASKQDTLVSATNIKTINGASVLGSGDLSVGSAWGGITGTLSSQTDLQSALDAKQATLVSATNIKTINGSTVLGSGNLTVSAGDPSYSPGSFTVATETWKLLGNHVKMTTTQRISIEGTARLRVSN